jgi:hypothetical protein
VPKNDRKTRESVRERERERERERSTRIEKEAVQTHIQKYIHI